MRTWRTNEVTLASFHVEKSFYYELLREVRPWIERASHVRNMIYLNATDSKRKDQEHWMRMYEDMIAKRMGEKYRFLPPDSTVPQPKEAPRGRTVDPDSSGFIRVRE